MILRLSSDRAGFDEPRYDLEPNIRSTRHPCLVIPFYSHSSRRPACRVPGCNSWAVEARLCHPHLILWRHAGAPADLDVWADAYARHRDATGANRIVRVRFASAPRPVRSKPLDRANDQIDWEPEPEEILEV